MAFYCVYIFLLTDWLIPHAILRNIMFATYYALMTYQRSKLEEFNIVPTALFALTAMVLAEFLGYLNMRTQVKLKLNMHSMQLQ